MLPWRLAFHEPISPALLAWIFTLGAGLAQALAMREILRRWFTEAGPFLALSLEIGYSATGLLLCLGISHETFDLPVLAGIFFTSWQIFFATKIFSGEISTRRRNVVLASLFGGLAVASRAVLLPSAGIILLGAAIFSRRWWAASGPFALCLAALATYNAARFGSPIDFGNRYTLVEYDWAKNAAFSARYVPLNAYYNFISVPKLSDRFPFFVDSASLPYSPPPGYLGNFVDRMMGCWPGYVFFFFALGGAALIFRRAENRGLRLLLLSLVSSGVVLGLVLCAFVGASVRYQAELFALGFVPAAIGATYFAARLGRSMSGKILANTVVFAALFWTSAGNISLATVGYRGLAVRNPKATDVMARVVDRALYPLQRGLGLVPKMPVLTLRFPSDKTGKLEPLWLGGRPGDADFIYVNYVSNKLIQFGFEAMGRGGPLSAAIPIDYGVTHELRLLLGPLAPVATHPLLRGKSAEAGKAPGNMLGLVLDGKIVMAAAVQFHDEKAVYFWGVSPDEPAFGRTFSGELKLTWRPFTSAEFEAWQTRSHLGKSR